MSEAASAEFITAGGRRLECRRIPTAAGRCGPTLVFLHEGLGCVSMWKDFPERVARASGLGALSYSRAGYGRSDPASLPRPVRYMHDEALAVLPELLARAGIEDAILIGHSDGASIAIVYAGSMATRERAARVRGLVLMAPHVFNESICVAGVRQAEEAYVHGKLRAGLARHHGEQVERAFWGWRDVWLHPEFWHWNIEEYLGGIGVPMLLIQGEDDNYGTVRQLEAIEAGAPAPVERLLLPACGHSPYRDQPQATFEATTGFIERLLRADAGAARAAQPRMGKL